MLKYKIRRPGRMMLTMAIEELVSRDQCHRYDHILGEFCSAFPGSCHDCWEKHLMWEFSHNGELTER